MEIPLLQLEKHRLQTSPLAQVSKGVFCNSTECEILWKASGSTRNWRKHKPIQNQNLTGFTQNHRSHLTSLVNTYESSCSLTKGPAKGNTKNYLCCHTYNTPLAHDVHMVHTGVQWTLQLLRTVFTTTSLPRDFCSDSEAEYSLWQSSLPPNREALCPSPEEDTLAQDRARSCGLLATPEGTSLHSTTPAKYGILNKQPFLRPALYIWKNYILAL